MKMCGVCVPPLYARLCVPTRLCHPVIIHPASKSSKKKKAIPEHSNNAEAIYSKAERERERKTPPTPTENFP